MKELRGLKYIAIFMVILVVVTLLLVGYFFATASVSIANYDARGVLCSDVPGEFEAIKKSVEDETFIGTRFSLDAIGEAENYALITYTLRISNQCLVPIDMIEIQVIPSPDDVLQLGSTEVYALKPKTQGDFTATVLVPKNSHSIRELVVTYYVWGVSFEIKAMYSDT